MLTSENALDILKDYDIVVDGTDNFATRYLVNDACVLLGKPNVYGSIFRFEGQASVFGYPDGPCYRCLYPEPPPPGLVPSCAEGGVLGVLPGIVGSIQAAETLKLIIGKGDPLVGRLLLFDALSMRFRELKLRKNPECPVCGAHPTITKLIDYAEFCGVRGEEAPAPASTVPEITPRELKARLDRGDDLFILDVREPHEYQICNIGGYLIPLGDLSKRVSELDSSREIVAHCRSGKRSAEAVGISAAGRLSQGFEPEGWYSRLVRRSGSVGSKILSDSDSRLSRSDPDDYARHGENMAQVKITIRPNGPYRVEAPEGTIELVDAAGNKFDLTGKPAFSLCRCGGSLNKPFCDGQHSKIGFIGAESAVKKAEEGQPPQG